ncbi:MAG: pantoate--beta-alanine ligase [Blastocatellia bacterium]|nr:pantoate--beta-alanine ligase [Chloracidobacterium sp.]MBL8185727.1 pantoate--beta-alanine ligase [Blastocatellia bacterium]HBE82555.1 pantoate--beta-alanine ligase [Blastocatellia bacterium]HRJ88482.1 pantoate--beta-alanine ligase [Pyrinomonadaceae bacterium]HRK50577.1 pantoate--beta-alanine ligase [Pyrinomonadaceae bacterium]
MEIINRRQRMFSIARKLRREHKTVGFVPTMGALHEGHLSLVREARQISDVVIVSIFVNPTQFNDKVDLERYPRDLAADAALLADHGVDYIFAPEASELYPPDFSTYVYVEGLSESLEGASRPGHFRGVATIVTILLNTVRPDFAVFGQKDAQQLAIIRRLNRDLGFETEIAAVPTVREESGLAMSSRNRLLTEEERERASVIYRSLRDAKTAFKQGERIASKLVDLVNTTLSSESLANVEYVAAVDSESLEPIEKIDDREALIAVAVRFGSVRLIDNVVLNRRQ